MKEQQNDLTQEELRKRTRELLTSLGELSVNDTLLLLGAFLKISADKIGDNVPKSINQDCVSQLVRRRRLSIIDADSEMKAFIYQLSGYHTGYELRDILVEKFGPRRAPSKSSIFRFLLKHGRTVKGQTEGVK